MKATEILKKYFGYESFREGQQELIDNILKHRDVLGIMPTGAGKSICYQVPAVMLEGITPVSYTHLLAMKKEKKSWNREEIKHWLAGNLCRCTGYMGQLRAIEAWLQKGEHTV